jgi:hypothetical protein
MLYLNRWRHIIVGVMVLCLVAIGVVVGLATTAGPKHPKAVPRVITMLPPTTTTTLPAATTTPTTPTTRKAALPAPIAIPGGTMTVIGGNVTLTTTVVKGESLWVIAGWFDQMGGWPAVYALNQSAVGKDPNLILPGEVLHITVPAADIPKISPAYLALTNTETTSWNQSPSSSVRSTATPSLALRALPPVDPSFCTGACEWVSSVATPMVKSSSTSSTSSVSSTLLPGLRW